MGGFGVGCLAEWAAVQALWRERSDKATVRGGGVLGWAAGLSGVFRGGPGLSRLRGRPCGNPPVLWDLLPTLEPLPAALKLPQLFSAPLFCRPRAWGWTAGRVDIGTGQGLGGRALGPGARRRD